MGTDYLPPDGTRLPFNFTEAGYTPPNSTSILFNFAPQGNFGTLKAAINVMQPNWETTQTYPKSCPKYVVGYGPGGVQIIKGRCLFGGIRDIQGIINGVPKGLTQGPLSAYINGILNKGESDLSASMRITRPVDLSAFVDTHQPDNLSANIEGFLKKGSGDLTAFLGTHSPGDINAYLGAHQPGDLSAYLNGIKKRGSGNLTGSVDTHLPIDLPGVIKTHSPGNLAVYLRAWKYGAIVDLPAYVRGWQSENLSASIETHTSGNVIGLIRGWVREVNRDLSANIRGYDYIGLSASIGTHPYDNLSTSIRAWHRNIYVDLGAQLRVYQIEELGAVIDTHMWGNLGAKVLPHPPPPITATIRGWVRDVSNYLTANIYGWQASDLSAYGGGHLPANLGMILRGWYYGVARDLTANIHGWQELNLTANIHPHMHGDLYILLKGVALGVPRDLPALIHGWQEGNLGVITKGGHSPGDLLGHIRIFQTTQDNLPASIRGWQTLNLGGIVDTHQPSLFSATIRPWHREHYGDLKGIFHGWKDVYMPASVDTHLPRTLGGIIRVAEKLAELFPAIIHGWEYRHLGMTLGGTHDPVNLLAQLFVEQRDISVISGAIYGWQATDLPAYLNIVFKKNLPAYILPVLPADLSAYLKVRLISNLSASTHGWRYYDLGATIDQIYAKNLPARISAAPRFFANLNAKLKGVGASYSDISAYTRGFAHRSLGGYVVATYLADITAYLFPVVPRYIKGIIHGWQEAYLQGILNGQDYPWNLTASITSKGYWNLLNAIIAPVRGVHNYSSLVGKVHPWEIRTFTANIFVDSAVNLGAYLNPRLQASDLHASIRPKMIRLTTLIKIPTMVGRDLSATINYLCFQTGVRNLSAFIYPKFKGDLYAFIRPLYYNYKPINLGAKVGYTDSILEVDKLKIGITVLPGQYFTTDRYKLALYVLDAKSILNAYIRGTLRYRGISAQIEGVDIPAFTFDNVLKNREKVLHTTYDGVFKAFEVVEISFKEAVKEYFYSSDGEYAWRTDRSSKWLLDIRSILPLELAVRLKRRLHRATTLSDLRSFSSIDEAMKHAIAYVTEYPQASLGASIYNSGTYAYLSGQINPKYIKSERTSLSSSITAKDSITILAGQDTISKI